MKTADAIAICEEWFAYLERQKLRSIEVQSLAALARTGVDGQKEAARRLRQIDTSITVYDGGRLEPAVRTLVKLAQSALTVLPK